MPHPLMRVWVGQNCWGLFYGAYGYRVILTRGIDHANAGGWGLGLRAKYFGLWNPFSCRSLGFKACLRQAFRTSTNGASSGKEEDMSMKLWACMSSVGTVCEAEKLAFGNRLRHKVVSLNVGPQYRPPKYYSPYFGGSQNGTPNFGNPP